MSIGCYGDVQKRRMQDYAKTTHDNNCIERLSHQVRPVPTTKLPIPRNLTVISIE